MASAAKPPERLIIQLAHGKARQRLELLGGDARLRIVQQARRNPCLAQRLFRRAPTQRVSLCYSYRKAIGVTAAGAFPWPCIMHRDCAMMATFATIVAPIRARDGLV